MKVEGKGEREAFSGKKGKGERGKVTYRKKTPAWELALALISAEMKGRCLGT